MQGNAVPADVTATYDLAPVDHVVAAVAAGGREPGSVVHVTNPRRVGLATITGYLSGLGYDLTPMPLDRWTARLRNQPGNAAAPVLDVFLDEMTGTGWSDLIFRSSVPDCPAITADVFGTYVDYFTRTGYLPKPGR